MLSVNLGEARKNLDKLIKQFGDEGVEELREIKCDTLDALLSQCVGENSADELFGKAIGKEEI
ncbi:MAG TPA: hypothetical protein GXZ58_09170 [Bacilli bacterium]|nr:hypothetical protein [Bacilli bacterium]